MGKTNKIICTCISLQNRVLLTFLTIVPTNATSYPSCIPYTIYHVPYTVVAARVMRIFVIIVFLLILFTAYDTSSYALCHKDKWLGNVDGEQQFSGTLPQESHGHENVRHTRLLLDFNSSIRDVQTTRREIFLGLSVERKLGDCANIDKRTADE